MTKNAPPRPALSPSPKQLAAIKSVVFVLALLLYVVYRFHAPRNPTPSTITHNTVLEIAWTIIPILILVVIAIPSFRLLYYGDKAPDATMTDTPRLTSSAASPGSRSYWLSAQRYSMVTFCFST